MKLREEINREHSKAMADRVAQRVINRPELLPELLALLEDEDPKISQRAAYPLTKVGDADPSIFQPYLNDLIRLSEIISHQAITRFAYRSIQHLHIPEEQRGPLYDACIDRVLDQQTPVAIRVHCMQIAANICALHPELAPELASAIRQPWDHGSPGFKSRGRKILKQLDQLNSR